jgi:hypothetical protein
MDDQGVVFVDSLSDRYFWAVEAEDHVHNSRTGQCVKNRYGPKCGERTHKTLLDKALDWVYKRLVH